MSTVLDRAKAAVQAREAVYGDSAKAHHPTTAKLWSAYIDHELTPVQVAVMMVLDKVARQKNDPAYRDNYDDMAGYADRAGHNAGVNEEKR